MKRNKKLLMYFLALNTIMSSYLGAATTAPVKYDKMYNSMVKNIEKGNSNEENYKLIEKVLNQRNKELKLYSMVYSGEEALEIIEEQKVDIIILDLKLKGMNGVDVIKEIEYKKIEKYRSSIIVVSGDYSMIRQVYNSDYIYRCFLKPFNFNEIEESIEKIICENNYEMETDVKSKINKELKKLKFNFTYKGTKYLSECIYQIYKSN